MMLGRVQCLPMRGVVLVRSTNPFELRYAVSFPGSCGEVVKWMYISDALAASATVPLDDFHVCRVLGCVTLCVPDGGRREISCMVLDWFDMR